MIYHSIKMLWQEKQKSYNLVGTLSLSILCIVLLLQVFNNQLINPSQPGNFDMVFLYKSLIFLTVCLICISLIVYSCQYYNKINSKFIGFLRISGYQPIKVVGYQMIQMVIILIISYILAMLISLIFIPLMNIFIYNYMNIDISIFDYSYEAFIEALWFVGAVLLVLLFMQFEYVNQSYIPSLIKGDDTVSFKIYKRNIVFEVIYILLIISGLIFVTIEPLNQGKMIPSLLCAIGIYGVIKRILPPYLKKRSMQKNIDGFKSIFYGQFILLTKQLNLFIFFYFLIDILTVITVLANKEDPRFLITYQVAYLVCNILLDCALISRFRLRRVHKESYYDNLYKLGLTPQEIKHICLKEVFFLYTFIFMMVIIYLSLVFVPCLLRKEVTLLLVMVLMMEFVFPIVISGMVSLYEERRYIEKWKQS